jgi:hypothetical protein
MDKPLAECDLNRKEVPMKSHTTPTPRVALTGLALSVRLPHSLVLQADDDVPTPASGLGVLPGSTGDSEVWGINDDGQIAGWQPWPE